LHKNLETHSKTTNISMSTNTIWKHASLFDLPPSVSATIFHNISSYEGLAIQRTSIQVLRTTKNDATTTTSVRVGPFVTHGNEAVLFALKGLTKALPAEHNYLIGRRIHACHLNGSSIAHPPLHPHHSNFGPGFHGFVGGGLPYIIKGHLKLLAYFTLRTLAYGTLDGGWHCWEKKSTFDMCKLYSFQSLYARGDEQCKLKEGGVECLWKRFESGTGVPLYKDLQWNINSHYEDIRPHQSTPLVFYIQVDMETTQTVARPIVPWSIWNPTTHYRSVDNKALYLNPYGIRVVPGEVCVGWFAAPVGRSGPILQAGHHTHSHFTTSMRVFTAEPTDLGLPAKDNEEVLCTANMRERVNSLVTHPSLYYDIGTRESRLEGGYDRYHALFWNSTHSFSPNNPLTIVFEMDGTQVAKGTNAFNHVIFMGFQYGDKYNPYLVGGNVSSNAKRKETLHLQTWDIEDGM
jgi:hypothetical protein